jgi:hypothetical protein
MKSTPVFGWLLLAALAATAGAQQATITPQVRSKATADTKITEIELEAHFVTTIRVPEPVNSVVVGDQALFQVEHSEHEPELVFVKALTHEPAESNLLISTIKGRQISFLLISRGEKRAGCRGTMCMDRCKTDGKLKPVRDPSCAVDEHGACARCCARMRARCMRLPMPAATRMCGRLARQLRRLRYWYGRQRAAQPLPIVVANARVAEPYARAAAKRMAS